MKLIADAGATKINWAIKRGDEIYTFNSSGYNPNVSDSNYLRQLLITAFPNNFKVDEVFEILYYGTGCGREFGKERVVKALKAFFKNAEVNVMTDLEGAAYSVYNNKSGLIGILGTGANAGFYNGERIVETPPSVGYLLGDEGSGAYLGKKLVAKIIRNEINNVLIDEFYKKYNLTKEELVSKVYAHAKVNQYLASFVPFIKENIAVVEMENLVKRSFQKYYEKYVMQIAESTNIKQMVIVGGVAKAFDKHLIEAFNEKSIHLKVVESPINELLKSL